MKRIEVRSLVRNAAITIVLAAFAVVSAGAAIGVVVALLVASVLLLVAVARTDVEVRLARLVDGESHTASLVADAGAPPVPHMVIARLSGPITFLSQGTLIRLLEGPPWPRYVVLDLSAVNLVDSGGTNELAYLVDFLEIRGGKVVVVGASRRIQAALERAAVIGRCVGGTTFTTLEDALNAITVRAPAAEANESSLPQAAGWT